ncbi:hypothetical protein [Massilia aquatica]|uniref:Uncharacterized protein n=1 Tax=Massilia aquatica TaxID=2609000 RepID=A0ABX0M594_9BURK|nr:hypothetical protein [Massilia aquatica]NHZ42380.1 hypothetical protein [Massilia aquatica]
MKLLVWRRIFPIPRQEFLPGREFEKHAEQRKTGCVFLRRHVEVQGDCQREADCCREMGVVHDSQFQALRTAEYALQMTLDQGCSSAVPVHRSRWRALPVDVNLG